MLAAAAAQNAERVFRAQHPLDKRGAWCRDKLRGRMRTPAGSDDVDVFAANDITSLATTTRDAIMAALLKTLRRRRIKSDGIDCRA